MFMLVCACVQMAAVASTVVRAGPRTRASAAAPAAAASSTTSGRPKRKAAANAKSYRGLDADSDGDADDDTFEPVASDSEEILIVPTRAKKKKAKKAATPKTPSVMDLFSDRVPRRHAPPPHLARELILIGHYRRRQYAEMNRCIREWKDNGSYWRLIEHETPSGADGKNEKVSLAASTFNIRLDPALTGRPYREMDADDRSAFATMFELINTTRPFTAFEMQYLEQSIELLWLAASNGNRIVVNNLVLADDDPRTEYEASADESKVLTVSRKISAVREQVRSAFTSYFVEFKWGDDGDGASYLPSVLVSLVWSYCSPIHHTDTFVFTRPVDISNAELFCSRIDVGPLVRNNTNIVPGSLLFVRDAPAAAAAAAAAAATAAVAPSEKRPVTGRVVEAGCLIPDAESTNKWLTRGAGESGIEIDAARCETLILKCQ